MPQPLEYDKNFLPCPVEDGDEIYRNGIFEFNISKMIAYLKQEDSGVSLTEIDIRSYFREFSSINETHVDSVNLDQPVIIAEISPDRYNMIDGNHRAEKARKNGKVMLPGYQLRVGQHLRFLTSKSVYESYVEYWNEKVRGI